MVQLSFLHSQDLTLFLYNHNTVEKYFRKQENVGVKLLKGARRLNYLQLIYYSNEEAEHLL